MIVLNKSVKQILDNSLLGIGRTRAFPSIGNKCSRSPKIENIITTKSNAYLPSTSHVIKINRIHKTHTTIDLLY